MSKLLFGCRATPWQKTFSLFPRECFHLKAAIVRSCSRRQVAGPGWLVVPPLVHWSGLVSVSLLFQFPSDSPPERDGSSCQAPPCCPPPSWSCPRCSGQCPLLYRFMGRCLVKLSVLDFCVRMFHYGPHLFYCYALNSGKSVIA